MDRRVTDYIRHLTKADRKTLVQKTLKAGEEVGELHKVVLPFESAFATTHRFIDRARILEEACDTALTVASVAYELGASDEDMAPAWGVAAERPARSLSERALTLFRWVGRMAEAVEVSVARGDGGPSPCCAARGLACTATAAAMAIARSLGFPEEDVEAMLERKMHKWADLQARDAGACFPLPFEIHVTVEEADPAAFRAACAALGVKPVVLDLGQRGGEPMKDLMTSSTYYGDNPGALAEMRRVSEGLAAAGLKVVREKIETVSWHPAAPSRAHLAPSMPPGCYVESHLNVVCTDSRRELLGVLAKSAGAHLSRNVFKRIDANTFTIMVTLRRHDGVVEDFRAEVERLKLLLETAGFEVEKEVLEFSIYDTRTSHDAAWLAARVA